MAGEASTGDEAVEQIRDVSPDLVLLDVELGDRDGFGVLEAVLEAVVEEKGSRPGPGGRDSDRTRPIPVRSSSRVELVALDAIDWVEAAGDYVRLHAGDRSFLHRETMSSLERRLPAGDFVRIHRSTIARVEGIGSIHFGEGGHPYVVLRDGTRRSLSRTGRERLEEALGESL